MEIKCFTSHKKHTTRLFSFIKTGYRHSRNASLLYVTNQICRHLKILDLLNFLEPSRLSNNQNIT